MSTSFDVLPHKAEVPSFGDVIAQATPRIKQYLARHGIERCPPLRFGGVWKKSEEIQGYTQDSPMRWSEKHTVWFYFDGLDGGTDVHWLPVDELCIEDWADEKAYRQRSTLLARYIDECLGIGFYWYFRRSAGQPALINLAYGYLAAVLAELTDGLIYSSDSAWDYERFPCRAEEFYDFYFEPELALNAELRQWTARRLVRLREEINDVS